MASPSPWVVRATVPSTLRVPISITPLLASVVAIRLPATVTLPLSVIPAAAPLVNVRSPPTDDAAIISAVVPLSTTACPVDPLVFKVTAPVNTFTEPRVMSSLL